MAYRNGKVDGEHPNALLEDTTMEWDNKALVELAVAAGWAYDRVLLHEGEVEGWHWDHADGHELCELGAWDEGPVVPDALRELLVGPCIERLAKRMEHHALADLLERLLKPACRCCGRVEALRAGVCGDCHKNIAQKNA